MTRCEMELCPNWTGDGTVCTCAVFDIEPPRPASLTDLVGLDPDFTGGLDATEYVARQNCDCGETRQAAVEQMRRALLDGLEQIERHGNGGACVGAGDVEQLIARVTLEVGRALDAVLGGGQ